MNFCENCHVVSENEYCPLCGSKKLRLVNEDDFCLITEASTSYSQMLAEIFQENDIPYSALPYGSGVESQFGIPLSNCRLFVPYSSYNKAIDLVRKVKRQKTERLQALLNEHMGELNVSQKLVKKFMKKLKIYDYDDFFDYCINIIESANLMEDAYPAGGHLSSGGHYIFCYAEKGTLSIDSTTFEILSLSINKNGS